MTEAAVSELGLQHVELLLSKINWTDILLIIVAIIIIAFIAKLLTYFTNIIADNFPNNRMKILAYIPLLKFSIYFSGIFIAIFFFINPSNDTLFTMLASVLIAAGFAIKDIVTSIIYGIIILIDKPFQVGDRINFRDIYGDVTAIGLNNVTVLSLENEIFSIPNHLFIDDLVGTNNLGTPITTCVVNIHLSSEANLELAISILEQLVKASPLIQLPYSCEIVVTEILSNIGTITIRIQIKCNINDVRNEESFRTYLIVEANKAFKKAHIYEANTLCSKEQ